jgi:ankyrin repeat protein
VGLHQAVLEGNLGAVREHIEAGSDLNEKEPSGGSSPLIIAATFGRTEVAMALIDAGADVDQQNNDGSTALLTAAFMCRTEIVEALLDAGADKSIRNNAGSTALEVVTVPFDDIQGIYDYLGAVLGPYGLELDYARIKMTRPRIAEMLQL